MTPLTDAEKLEQKRANWRRKAVLYRQRHPERAKACLKASQQKRKANDPDGVRKDSAARMAQWRARKKSDAEYLARVSAYNKAYRLEHLEEEKARNAKSLAKNKDARSKRYREEYYPRVREAKRAYNTARRETHAEYYKAYSKEYWRKNKEMLSARYAEQMRKHRAYHTAKSALRRAMQLRATPTWANRDDIAAIYRDAMERTKATGVRHDVDHIYPLKSKSVCGLHVACNLQVLTHVENVLKQNKMPEAWAREKAELRAYVEVAA